MATPQHTVTPFLLVPPNDVVLFGFGLKASPRTKEIKKKENIIEKTKENMQRPTKRVKCKKESTEDKITIGYNQSCFTETPRSADGGLQGPMRQ